MLKRAEKMIDSGSFGEAAPIFKQLIDKNTCIGESLAGKKSFFSQKYISLINFCNFFFLGCETKKDWLLLQ